MCSYNAINGVPACANRELLTELLRETWKFDGFVVSDCGAVGNVYHRHNFARSDTEAAEFCVKAGCDWNCGKSIMSQSIATQSAFYSSCMLYSLCCLTYYLRITTYLYTSFIHCTADLRTQYIYVVSMN